MLLLLQSAGNMRFRNCVCLVLLASSAFTQTVNHHNIHRLWEPPAREVLENTKATVPKEVLSSIRVANYDIMLGKTGMEDVQGRLGGEIGKRVDASDTSEWLCFHGADAIGKWIL